MFRDDFYVDEDLARQAAREQELADVRNLLESVERLDRPYLLRWAGRLSIGQLYREVGA